MLKDKTILCACLIVLSIMALMTNNLAFAVASNKTMHDPDIKNFTNDPPSQIARLESSNETSHDPILNSTNEILLIDELVHQISLLYDLIIGVLVLGIVIGVALWAVRGIIRNLRELKELHPILQAMPKLLYVAIILFPIILITSTVFMISIGESISDILLTIIALVPTIMLSMLNMWISKWRATVDFQKVHKKLNDTTAILTNLKQETVASKHNLNSIDSALKNVDSALKNVDSALKNVDSALNGIHDILDKINKKLDKPSES